MEKIFWAIIIAIGVWAALTPGRQIPSAVPDKYRVRLPTIVILAAAAWIGYMVFIDSK